jgi:Ca2+-binding RTX toxin-like protein
VRTRAIPLAALSLASALATVCGVAAGTTVVRGTDGDDRLVGNADRNYLQAYAGNDVLDGRAGSDILKGGPGRDRLIGGASYDFINGQKGDDRLIGDRGPDYLDAGQGDDIVIGGPGNDYFDDLVDNWGDDVYWGGPGADGFDLSGPGADVFHLGRGDDGVHLWSDHKRDVVWCGEGVDHVYVDQPDRHDRYHACEYVGPVPPSGGGD